MSPVFEFNPTKVSDGFDVFPKGEYEFIVGTPKSFLKQAGEDNHDSFGVRYPLTIAFPDKYDGKRTIYSTYYQSEGAQSMARGFMMAVLGYGKGTAEGERFNRDYADKDWSFDPSNGTVSNIYLELEGKRVIGSLDVQKNNRTSEDMQNFKGWRSIASGPIGG